jgi:RNA polymerase sigma-70 factor (ECF subfamily)
MAAPLTPSDCDLLRRLRSGDEEAFSILYRRHVDPLHRYALRMSGSAATAEDVTQEVFMALIHQPDGYDAARGPLRPYLYGVTRHCVLRRLEREQRYVSIDEGHEAGDGRAEAAADHDPMARLSQQEIVARVHRALLALAPHHREAVVLCELEGLSYAEAAALLGCAVGTVRSRLHRARGLLLAALSREPVAAAGVRSA